MMKLLQAYTWTNFFTRFIGSEIPPKQKTISIHPSPRFQSFLRRRIKKLLVISSTLIFCLTSLGTVSATSIEDCEKDPIPQDKLSDCIDILSKKIGDLSTQKKTLSSQIAQFDSQIQVTQLKIKESQTTIDRLEKEITALSARIGFINVSLDKLEILLKKRIVATYQQSYISNLELLVTSNGFSDLILKAQYLKQVQENDRKILLNLQQTKANYANQKDEREVKQAQIEESKKKLESLKVSLDSQKVEKQTFLEITKNDEARYQSLLAQAQAEQAAVFGGGKETFMRDVKEGEKIGNVISGPSACSTGTHLHFEVHKDGTVRDPSDFLKNTNFSYAGSGTGDIHPNGPWNWPIDNPIIISQGFGHTPYANSSHVYGPGGHTGIDMYNNPSSFPVKAVKQGKLYGGSVGCGGKTLYYAKIEQDDGIKTWYLHMIPS